MKKFLAIITTALLFGCTGITGGFTMSGVKNGDHVWVDYVGTLNDGTLFDTSIESVAREHNAYQEGRGYAPIDFVVGEHKVIPGFEQGVLGMKVGETKKIVLTPEQAYGYPDPKMIIALPKEQLSAQLGGDVSIKKGMILITNQNMQGIITDVNETDVVVDFNNPLAGKTLNFEVTLVKKE